MAMLFKVKAAEVVVVTMAISKHKETPQILCKFENGIYHCKQVHLNFIPEHKMINKQEKRANSMPPVAHALMIFTLLILFFHQTVRQESCKMVRTISVSNLAR